MIVKFLVNTTLDGRHRVAGERRELDDETGQTLIDEGKAILFVEKEAPTPPPEPTSFVVKNKKAGK